MPTMTTRGANLGYAPLRHSEILRQKRPFSQINVSLNWRQYCVSCAFHFNSLYMQHRPFQLLKRAALILFLWPNIPPNILTEIRTSRFANVSAPLPGGVLLGVQCNGHWLPQVTSSCSNGISNHYWAHSHFIKKIFSVYQEEFLYGGTIISFNHINLW